MTYALSQALTDLKRDTLWNGAAVSTEPMVGTVNGSNQIFRTVSSPIDEDTLQVFNSSLTQLTSGVDYTLSSAATGTVVMTSAPVATVYASYTATELTTTDLNNLILSGFDEMESRYPRGYYLYDTGGGALVISSSSSTETDPDLGNGLSFSESKAEIGFFLLCCRYRVAMAMWERAAAGAVSYREERMGGLMVDTTKTPDGWKKLADVLDGRIEEYVTNVMQSPGTIIAAPRSDVGRRFDWWTNNDQERGLTRYGKRT